MKNWLKSLFEHEHWCVALWMFKGLVHLKMTRRILEYIICVEQLYCVYSWEVEFMVMLHQTIRLRKSLLWYLIIEIQTSSYLLQTFKPPGKKLIMHHSSIFLTSNNHKLHDSIMEPSWEKINMQSATHLASPLKLQRKTCASLCSH